MKPLTSNGGSTIRSDGGSLRAWFAQGREAQRTWAGTPVSERIRVVSRVRQSIERQGAEIATAWASLRGRSVAEVQLAELTPLLDAHRFIEREGGRLLSPRNLPEYGRPLWLRAVDAEIQHVPRGVVLVIGSRKYPLFLPCVQILQALAAGNRVIFMPFPNTAAAARILIEIWNRAGLPRGLIEFLPEFTESAFEAIRQGVDFVVLTGSAAAGEVVFKWCVEHLIPCVIELSGCDAAIVRNDADPKCAALSLAFGLRMNGGATCVAPRHVYVVRSIAERLEENLIRVFENERTFPAPDGLKGECGKLLADAERRDATVLVGGRQGNCLMLPLVIFGGEKNYSVGDDEIFAPALVVTVVDDDGEAIAMARRCGYVQGTSVFSNNGEAARRIAACLNAGVVVINDMIIPTTEPWVLIGGNGRSGFGITRGAEGLLAMTVPKLITSTKGQGRPHFVMACEIESEQIAGYTTSIHCWRRRGMGLKVLWSGLKTCSREILHGCVRWYRSCPAKINLI